MGSLSSAPLALTYVLPPQPVEGLGLGLETGPGHALVLQLGQGLASGIGNRWGEADLAFVSSPPTRASHP